VGDDEVNLQRRIPIRLVMAAVCWLFTHTSYKAQEALGSWTILNISSRINDHLTAFGEAQLRSLRFYNHFHYYEYKGGLSYRVNAQFSLLAGGGRYDTYGQGGDFVNPRQVREYRSWLQGTLRNDMGRWTVEHRYRVEQRYTSIGYRNRFRYRISCTYALNRPVLETGAWYLNATNETFFTNTAPYFERNRSSVSIGYEWSDNLTIQIGYLHQFDYKIEDETGRDFLQIGFYLEPVWPGQRLRHRPGSLG